jgi:hypothetical protein
MLRKLKLLLLLAGFTAPAFADVIKSKAGNPLDVYIGTTKSATFPAANGFTLFGTDSAVNLSQDNTGNLLLGKSIATSTQSHRMFGQSSTLAANGHILELATNNRTVSDSMLRLGAYTDGATGQYGWISTGQASGIGRGLKFGAYTTEVGGYDGTGVWDFTKAVRVGGSTGGSMSSKVFTLVDGASLLSSGGGVIGRGILLLADIATENVIMYLMGNTTVNLVSDTSGVGAASDTAGKTCVFWTGSTWAIKNRLGTTVNYRATYISTYGMMFN